MAKLVTTFVWIELGLLLLVIVLGGLTVEVQDSGTDWSPSRSALPKSSSSSLLMLSIDWESTLCC